MSNDPGDDVQPSAALLTFRAALSGFRHDPGAQTECNSPGATASNDFPSAPPATATTPRRLTRSSSRISLTGNIPVDGDTVGALVTQVETASLQSPSPSPRKRNRASDDTGSPTKKFRTAKGYAPPEVYAHLNALTDRLAPNLDVVFCGINPGVMSATRGAHYGNPRNHFWKALHESGFTPRLVNPLDEHILPAEFSLGLTDIVERPTTGSDELSKTDFRQGVPALLGKLARYRPRIVCLVGKEVWQPIEDAIRDWSCTGATATTLAVEEPPSPPVDSESLAPQGVPVASPSKGKKTKTKAKKPARSISLGLQPYKLVHPAGDAHCARETLFYVMVSTSPIVAQYRYEDKVDMMRTVRRTLDMLKAGDLEGEMAGFRSLILTTTSADADAVS
ncbi:DNA glycosylase [Auricularia subglabra TFB-10046 SS5]|nr:DNA glycosylase [Auricularia subglabra TFB-10046 SS5]